jgi:hypothetical protein
MTFSTAALINPPFAPQIRNARLGVLSAANVSDAKLRSSDFLQICGDPSSVVLRGRLGKTPSRIGWPRAAGRVAGGYRARGERSPLSRRSRNQTG